MAKPDNRRTPTLSISLTTELMAAVDARVQSGLYTSASELLREALRLFLQVEQARTAKLSGPTTAASFAERLATTFDLFDLGVALHAHKLRQAEPGVSDEDVQKRLLDAAVVVEGDQVIRPAPERLKRLRAGHGPH
jgi:putative addiction module CopG family antidote